VDGQQVHRKERKHQSDTADDSRSKRAGMGEFHVESEDAQNQQNEKRIGLNDAGEKFFTAGHFLLGNDRMRERNFCSAAVEPGDGGPVQLREQIFLGGGHDINELAIQSFLVAKRLGIGDGSGGEFDVAAALAGIAAQIGQRVVDNFLAEGVVNLN